MGPGSGPGQAGQTLGACTPAGAGGPGGKGCCHTLSRVCNFSKRDLCTVDLGELCRVCVSGSLGVAPLLSRVGSALHVHLCGLRLCPWRC